MDKFLVEVPHEPDPKSCLIAIKTLLSTGSHFITHADWGCTDGVHKSWMVLELGSKEEAVSILPPAYRSGATVVKLNRFDLKISFLIPITSSY